MGPSFSRFLPMIALFAIGSMVVPSTPHTPGRGRYRRTHGERRTPIAIRRAERKRQRQAKKRGRNGR